MDDENWTLCMARDAYSAYGAVTDFKNYQGLTMPRWDQLPDKIKQAWVAATKRTKEAVENNFRPKNAARSI